MYSISLLNNQFTFTGQLAPGSMWADNCDGTNIPYPYDVITIDNRANNTEVLNETLYGDNPDGTLHPYQEITFIDVIMVIIFLISLSIVIAICVQFKKTKRNEQDQSIKI